MRIRALLLIAGGIVGIACSDATTPPSAPHAVANDSRLLGLTGVVSTIGNVLVAPVHRRVALSDPVSWSFTVGSGGAVSTNAATGLTVSVPAGAVSSPVTITVTALAGTPVAYRFEPHGLQFARDVRLTQSLSVVNVGLLNSLLFQGAHFSGAEPTYTGGLALVTETVAAPLSLLQGSVSFPIRHFSGWIIASGRSSSTSSDE